MADSSVAITAGAGTPIRLLTALGAGSAGQQVFTLGDSSGNLLGTSSAPVPVEDFDQSATISIAATATSSGQLTGLNAAGTATVQLTGTFVATVQVQVTADGSTWVNITGSNSISNVATGAYVASGNLTAVGLYQVEMAGCVGIRVITTAYTSGTVAGVVRQSGGAGLVGIEGVPAVTVSSGTVTLSANTPTIAAGTNAIGALTAVQGSAASTYSLNTAASTNAAVVKASAGNLYELTISNTSASAIYVKLFQKATAPTVGTDTPVVTLLVAANADRLAEWGVNGKRFQTGIGVAVTGAQGPTDTTAVAAGIQIHGTYI